jgi:hypothetical protein
MRKQSKLKPLESGERRLNWECRDPNNDDLTYLVSYRPKSGAKWTGLLPETRENSLVFDTRRIADGWYVFRLTASDKPVHPAEEAMTRTLETPLELVDNSPPSMTGWKTEKTATGWTVSGSVEDDWSEIRSVEYSLSGEDWALIGAEDGAYDSQKERAVFSLPQAEKPDSLMIRVMDSRGNTRISPVFFE